MGQHLPVEKSADSCEFPQPTDELSIFQKTQLALTGKGKIESTPVFYGFYQSAADSPTKYNLPLWYTITTSVLFLVSLILISVKAGQGMEKEIVGKSGNLFKYSLLILSGWDCNISDKDTATIKKRLKARVTSTYRVGLTRQF